MLAAAVGLGGAPPAEAATRTRTIPGTVVVRVTTFSRPDGTAGCNGTAYLDFPAVPRATSYTASWLDGNPRVGAVTRTGPPFEDRNGGTTTPRGTHRFGMTAFGNFDCSYAQTIRSRFSKIRVTAAGPFDSRKARLSGVVVRRQYVRGLEQGPRRAVRGAPGVRVTATGGGRSFTASTGSDGGYAMIVPRGR